MSGTKPNSSYDQCEVDDMRKRVNDGEFDGSDDELTEDERESKELWEEKIQYFEDDVLKTLLFKIADILGIDEDVKELI